MAFLWGFGRERDVGWLMTSLTTLRSTRLFLLYLKVTLNHGLALAAGQSRGFGGRSRCKLASALLRYWACFDTLISCDIPQTEGICISMTPLINDKCALVQ